MNRLRLQKQRAIRRGFYIYKDADAGPARTSWDVIDSCGPQGLKLTKRAAINQAARLKPAKVRIYGTDSSDVWHRAGCIKIVPAHVAGRPCKCQRLVV